MRVDEVIIVTKNNETFVRYGKALETIDVDEDEEYIIVKSNNPTGIETMLFPKSNVARIKLYHKKA